MKDLNGQSGVRSEIFFFSRLKEYEIFQNVCHQPNPLQIDRKWV